MAGFYGAWPCGDRGVFLVISIYISYFIEIWIIIEASSPAAECFMTTQSAPDLDDVIKALAHPVRREILHWLKTPQQSFASQEHSFELGVCAGKIFERASLSQSTISSHLAILQRTGLVTTRKVGQWIFYSRNEALIAEFLKRIQNDL